MKQHIENALKGAALGAINALLVAIGISTVISGLVSALLPTIVVLCMFWAIPIGAVLGVIAGKLRRNRLAVLEVIALAAIPMVGAVTLGSEGMLGHHGSEDFLNLVLMAASATAVLVVILERWAVPVTAAIHALGHLPIAATPSSSRPRPSAPRTAGAPFRT